MTDLRELIDERYYYFISAKNKADLELFRAQRPWARSKTDQELIDSIITSAGNASL